MYFVHCTLYSVLWIKIRIRMDPHWLWSAESGSRRAKNCQQKYKKWKNFMFWNTGCPLLRAEGFSWSLDVLSRCLRITKSKFFYHKFFVFPLGNDKFLVFKTHDPDPHWPKMLVRIRIQGPDPGSGSTGYVETRLKWLIMSKSWNRAASSSIQLTTGVSLYQQDQ